MVAVGRLDGIDRGGAEDGDVVAAGFVDGDDQGLVASVGDVLVAGVALESEVLAVGEEPQIEAVGPEFRRAEFHFDLFHAFGDIDGKITVDDATLLQRAAVDYVRMTDTQTALADTNGDGRVSVLDVTCVQKYIAGFTSGMGKTGEIY